MRSVVVITPPSALPIDAETARRSLRLGVEDATEEDLERLIAAATAQIDGPSGWLGRAIMAQTLELRLDAFTDLEQWQPHLILPRSDGILFPFPPYIGNLSVKYDDESGTEQTVDPAKYRVVGGDRPQLICKSGQDWPSTSGERECVRIRYDAGYGEDADAVPAPIRQAVMVMVQQSWNLGERNLFTSAETVDGVGSAQYIVTDNAAKVMRDAAANLLAGYRVFG